MALKKNCPEKSTELRSTYHQSIYLMIGWNLFRPSKRKSTFYFSSIILFPQTNFYEHDELMLGYLPGSNRVSSIARGTGNRENGCTHVTNY